MRTICWNLDLNAGDQRTKGGGICRGGKPPIGNGAPQGTPNRLTDDMAQRGAKERVASEAGSTNILHGRIVAVNSGTMSL
jgi:hypothetical protein